MRILHTADWHLGKKLNDFTRIEEQRNVLEEICEIAQKEEVDAVVIAGDLFDTFNPPNEAIELLFKTVHKLANNGNIPVIAIAGNHVEDPSLISISKEYKHILTHQIIYSKFFIIDQTIIKNINLFLTKNSVKLYTIKKIKALPKPVLINKYLKEHIF